MVSIQRNEHNKPTNTSTAALWPLRSLRGLRRMETTLKRIRDDNDDDDKTLRTHTLPTAGLVTRCSHAAPRIGPVSLCGLPGLCPSVSVISRTVGRSPRGREMPTQPASQHDDRPTDRRRWIDWTVCLLASSWSIYSTQTPLASINHCLQRRNRAKTQRERP